MVLVQPGIKQIVSDEIPLALDRFSIGSIGEQHHQALSEILGALDVNSTFELHGDKFPVRLPQNEILPVRISFWPVNSVPAPD